MLFRWSWRLTEAVVGSGCVVKMAVSSANVLSIVLLDVGRSAVYIVYNNGPRMLPWGTPESIGILDKVSLLNFVMKYLSCRHDFNNEKYPGDRVYLILYSSPGCQALSNAWLTSKKTAVQYCFSSRALFILSFIRWHCCFVECAFLNPNWCCGNHVWGFASLYILLSMSFSKIFYIIGRRLIGRYDVTSVGFLPGLGIIMIFACFKCFGQYSSLRMAFNMYRRFK